MIPEEVYYQIKLMFHQVNRTNKVDNNNNNDNSIPTVYHN